MGDWVGIGLAQASRLIHDRQLSPTTYVEALLEHIARLEPDLQAWAAIDHQGALDQAQQRERELDDGRDCGPLHGIPIAFKDLFDIEGTETRAGSNVVTGTVARQDAAAVARLRAAGAIIMGKTKMTVFAAMDPANTVNPWNRQYTPGGSSSGSASAVASCMCPAALGSQTAGSVLRPASYCGIVGLKPTYGALPNEGMFPSAWSLDHVGIMCRSVADAALVLEAMGGSSVRTDSARGGRFVLGVPDRYFSEGLDADVEAAFRAALDAYREAGAEIREIALPPTFEAGVDAGVVTMHAETAAVHRDRFAAHRSDYPFRITAQIEAGLGITAADYLRAQQIRRLFVAELSAMLDGIHCLLTPATPTPAPKGLSATGDWRFNLPFSVSGHPSMSIPCGVSSDGMPIGLQLVASHRGECRLFEIGSLFQAHTEWHERRPFS